MAVSRSEGEALPASAPLHTTRYVAHERDALGRPYAVEVVEADRWLDEFLEPPDPTVADARLVRLGAGGGPSDLPRWLGVETGADQQIHLERIGEKLWPWSPHHREPGASLQDFLSAGASALRYPDPAPAESERQLDMLTRFASDCLSPLREVATRRSDALERWLLHAFGEPDRFAEAILLERIAEAGCTDVLHELRFLRAARVPPAYAELRVDRQVLLEQASPWRFFEPGSLGGAIEAIRAWRRRYRLAYEAHYRAIVSKAIRMRSIVEGATIAGAALSRLDGVQALGPPVGAAALADLESAATMLTALPPDPDPETPCTAGVVLGEDPPAFAALRAAADAVEEALEIQRRRLASETVARIPARPGVPALDRLLQAIVASDVDAIERVLDQPLVDHLERLLANRTASPFASLAERYPTVTAETLDEAVDTFRAMLSTAIADSPDGLVALRDA